jgi:hypothetical protein
MNLLSIMSLDNLSSIQNGMCIEAMTKSHTEYDQTIHCLTFQ